MSGIDYSRCYLIAALISLTADIGSENIHIGLAVCSVVLLIIGSVLRLRKTS
jgi:hypothetical protein